MMLKNDEIRLASKGQEDLRLKVVGRQGGDHFRMPGDAHIELNKEIEKPLLPEKVDVPFKIGGKIGAGQERPKSRICPLTM